MTDQAAFRFVDLFAGIGGLRLGFESIGGRCVFTSEWNKFDIATALGGADDAARKAMFAATQAPTDAFNARLKSYRGVAQDAENAYQKARTAEDHDGMKKADHNRKEAAELIGGMLEFKAGLSRFARAYAYIAQLIDLGDPELENFAAFAKLLANRLDGVPPENVDLRGIALTGYDIKPRPDGDADGADTKTILQPFGAGGSPQPGPLPVYIQELIQKLNSLFGQAAPLKDQAAFVNQIASIAQENQVVMAQVEKNPKDQAMKGNLPGAVEAAVARAMTSHASLATLLLKADKQAMGIFTNLIYDMLKHGERIDVDHLESV